MTSSHTRKECKSCGREKALAEFYFNRSKGTYDPSCKECRSDLERAKRTPEITRQKNLWQKFQITSDQFDDWLREQGGVCAICKQPETHTWRGKPRELSVDHDHSTGEIRRLLCHRCNTLIGLAREDINILLSAVEYLKIKELRANAI